MPTIDFDPDADYYQALGVTERSNADEIKKAYRKLAKQYHPDSTGGDKAKESKFKTISIAYDVIGDVQKRELYDRIRANGGVDPGQHGAGDFNLADLFVFLGHRTGARVRDVEVRPEPESTPDKRAVRASDGLLLRVDGFDVHSDVTISFDQAILGTMVTVATIDGRADVKIPSGSSSGRKLRLRGKGVFNPGGFTGDHHITVQIEVPSEINDDEKKLVVQLADKLRKKRRSSP